MAILNSAKLQSVKLVDIQDVSTCTLYNNILLAINKIYGFVV